MEKSLRKRAESAVSLHLRSLAGEKIFRNAWPSHTKTPEDNLVAGVTNGDFWGDLRQGDGNEIVDSPSAPAKFCAAYSSAALVVNNFGPFRHSPKTLVLAGHSNFNWSQFESKCPTPLRGRAPNLDFLASGPTGLVAVESKFLEPLTRPKVNFSKRYGPVVRDLADPAWQGMYKSLLEETLKFNHLDAAQLIKHYLGIQNTFRDFARPKVLLYLYWEPVNVLDIADYLVHRQEVDLFSTAVDHSNTQFTAISYQDLWNYWSKESDWEGMPSHIDTLKKRYEISI